MSSIFRVKKSGLPLIPEGEYSAVFASHEVKEGLQYGDAVRMVFEIDDGEQKGTSLDLLARAELKSSTKFGQILSTLLGKPLKEDTDVDLETLYGTPCLIEVVTRSGNKGGNFSTIEKVKAR
jgi:hypothetical protein